MTTHEYVKPGGGRKVRHPETGVAIPAAGGMHPTGILLHRRLADGDLVKSEPAKAKKGGSNR